jgi:hypothetical protein
LGQGLSGAVLFEKDCGFPTIKVIKVAASQTGAGGDITVHQTRTSRYQAPFCNLIEPIMLFEVVSSVLSNMRVSIEQHVEWITGCIEHMRKHGVATIEARADAEMQWTAHAAKLANASLLPTAKSWYIGANIPGKSRVFMPYLGGVGPYRQKHDAIAAKGYEGLTFAA